MSIGQCLTDHLPGEFHFPGALGLAGGVEGGLGLAGGGVVPLLPELWLLPEFVEVGLGLLVVEGMGHS